MNAYIIIIMVMIAFVMPQAAMRALNHLWRKNSINQLSMKYLIAKRDVSL